jgi:hypothetical protein
MRWSHQKCWCKLLTAQTVMQEVDIDTNSGFELSEGQGIQSFTLYFWVLSLRDWSGQAQWRTAYQGMLNSNLNLQHFVRKHCSISLDEARWGSPRYRGLFNDALVVGLLQGVRVKLIEKAGFVFWLATNGQLSSNFRLGHSVGLLCSISMNVFEVGALGTKGSMLET